MQSKVTVYQDEKYSGRSKYVINDNKYKWIKLTFQKKELMDLFIWHIVITIFFLVGMHIYFWDNLCKCGSFL